jgi:hypothetical protein
MKVIAACHKNKNGICNENVYIKTCIWNVEYINKLKLYYYR